MQTIQTSPRPRIIELGYQAREQFVPFHKRRERWACLVAHRRAGKTVACVMDLLDAALMCKKPEGRFGYVAPYYVQAKDAAWTYAKRFSLNMPGAVINESELRIDFPHNGARLRLYGADNYDRMRGSYFDGVILDEYGDMHPAAWPEVVRPMLADRRGWAVFIGTPKGRNDFYSVWERSLLKPGQEGYEPGWFSMMLRSSESGLLADDEIEAIRLQLTPEQFEQEMECNFDAAIQGAYYGKEIVEAERAGRIGVVEVDPILPVHTAWDLGVGANLAVWFFQVAPDGVRIVDYIEGAHSDGIEHMVVKIRAKNYRTGAFFVPHDAKAKEITTGRTRIETLMGLHNDIRLVADHKEDDGINAGRVSFKHFWFDAIRCRNGLEALRQFRADFDEKTKKFTDKPFEDWTNHAADAFRYLAMAWRAMKPEKPVVKPKQDLIYEADAHGRVRANMSVREIVEKLQRERKARLG